MKKIRVYVLSLKGSNQELFLLPSETEIIVKRATELVKGQTLTIRVTEKTAPAVAAEVEFQGW